MCRPKSDGHAHTHKHHTRQRAMQLLLKLYIGIFAQLLSARSNSHFRPVREGKTARTCSVFHVPMLLEAIALGLWVSDGYNVRR